MSCGEREKTAEIEPMFQYEFNQLAVYENGRTPCLLTEKQYRRVRACVNACDGVQDPSMYQLGKMLKLADKQRTSIFNLERQRDELLAELLRVKDICLREVGIGIVNEVVIARVKGGALWISKE